MHSCTLSHRQSETRMTLTANIWHRHKTKGSRNSSINRNFTCSRIAFDNYIVFAHEHLQHRVRTPKINKYVNKIQYKTINAQTDNPITKKASSIIPMVKVDNKTVKTHKIKLFSKTDIIWQPSI